MNKKFISILMMILLLFVTLVSCSKEEAVSETETQTTVALPSQNSTSITYELTDKGTLSRETIEAIAGTEMTGETLTIGTMAMPLGLPVYVAESMGLFDSVGLDVQMDIFASGTPINEAMAADQFDMAVSGWASVYALATGEFTYIGDGCMSYYGQKIYGRPDGAYANDTSSGIENVLGSADTIRGVSVLAPSNTSSHFLTLQYVQALGLTPSDIEFVNMQYPDAYSAFITGNGDLIATTNPYNQQLADGGYVEVCDLTDIVPTMIADAIYCQNRLIEDGTRNADILAFLDCFYVASQMLVDDPDLWYESGMKWYSENGYTYTDSDMTQEIDSRTFNTFETLCTPEHEFGFGMEILAEFYNGVGSIEDEGVELLKACINDSFVRALQEAHIKAAV